VIRVAAVGDVHVGIDSAGRLAPRLAGLADHADVLLLAGDLTHRGRPEEAKVLAEELRGVGVPTVAVLGNHDYHSDEQDAVAEVLEEAGIRVLEGSAVVVKVRGRRVGIAGSKGFGGGFAGASASDFGEPEMKAFVGHTRTLAGDLTHRGRAEEAKVLAEELRGVRVPTLAVLGNHDYHSDEQDAVTEVLEQAGIRVLEGAAVVLEIGGRRVGIAGSKGFGGGFAGASATDFGEPEMRAFVGHTKALAGRLERALAGLHTDRRIVLLHYSPVAETLAGEPREIHAFLGSYLLAEAVDRAGADLVLHGHAHRGSRDGTTPGGVPVRNVAAPVIGRAYEVFRFDAEGA
jgi:Icc-related predicted phosphoesterase